jgi:hypothetical protein
MKTVWAVFALVAALSGDSFSMMEDLDNYNRGSHYDYGLFGMDNSFEWPSNEYINTQNNVIASQEPVL